MTIDLAWAQPRPEVVLGDRWRTADSAWDTRARHAVDARSRATTSSSKVGDRDRSGRSRSYSRLFPPLEEHLTDALDDLWRTATS